VPPLLGATGVWAAIPFREPFVPDFHWELSMAEGASAILWHDEATGDWSLTSAPYGGTWLGWNAAQRARMLRVSFCTIVLYGVM
jgi:hypothetical protein